MTPAAAERSEISPLKHDLFQHHRLWLTQSCQVEITYSHLRNQLPASQTQLICVSNGCHVREMKSFYYGVELLFQ